MLYSKIDPLITQKKFHVNGWTELDCNSIVNPGIYSDKISPEAINSPGYWAYFIVFTGNNCVTQLAIGFSIPALSIRVLYPEDTWQDWKRII